MISQFFILSPRGDVIIRRDYLGNVPKVRSPHHRSLCCMSMLDQQLHGVPGEPSE
jgi:hypothetical protein